MSGSFNTHCEIVNTLVRISNEQFAGIHVHAMSSATEQIILPSPNCLLVLSSWTISVFISNMACVLGFGMTQSVVDDISSVLLFVLPCPWVYFL